MKHTTRTLVLASVAGLCSTVVFAGTPALANDADVIRRRLLR